MGFRAAGTVVGDRDPRRPRRVAAAGSTGREGAARRAQCLDNLEPLGLAIDNDGPSHGVLPMMMALAGTGNTVDCDTGWGAQARVLPYLEGSTLFNAANIGVFKEDPSNSTVIMLSLATFLCPSEARPGQSTYDYGVARVVKYSLAAANGSSGAASSARTTVRPSSPTGAARR
jgi:hypothetical protein